MISGYLEADILNKLDLIGAILKIQYGGTPPCGENWEFSVNIPHARQKLYAKFRVYSFYIELGRSLLILAGFWAVFAPGWNEKYHRKAGKSVLDDQKW